MKKMLYIIASTLLPMALSAMEAESSSFEIHPEIAILIKSLQNYNTLPITPHKILIHGTKGIGKTTQISHLINQLKTPFIALSGANVIIAAREENAQFNPALLLYMISNYCNILCAQVQEANKSMGILYIDHINALFTGNELSKAMGPHLEACCHTARSQGIDIRIIGELNGSPTQWFQRHFDKIISIQLPEEDTRKNVLKQLMQRYGIFIDTSVCIETLAQKTEGFTPAELSKVIMEVIIRAENPATQDDFSQAIAQIKTNQHEKDAQEYKIAQKPKGHLSYFM